jgi:peptide/nickel transport system substrate-binding protein
VKTRKSTKLFAAVAAVSLVLAACGGDDDAGDEGTVEDTADATAEGTAEGTAEATAEGTAEATAEGTAEATAEGTSDGTASAYTAGVGEVGGSGCGIPHGPYDAKDAPSGEVRVAWNDPLLSFNNNTTHGNATANANVDYLMNANQFAYYDGDLNLVNNDQFGTCVIESLDPLTITYHVNEGVSWSDGVQVDAADLLLAWGSASGKYNQGNVTFLEDGTAIKVDDDGNWLVTTPEGDIEPEAPGVSYDPETFELYEGYAYIPDDGVNFDGSSEAYELVTEVPTITDDGLGITMTYDSFYVDYQNVAPTGIAAHTVARLALGIDDPAEAKAALIAAMQDSDGEALAKIAPVWNSAFDTDQLPDDPGLYLSSGPYLLTSYDQRAQMTFEANPDYTWGPQPSIQTIVYRIIGDPTAAVQALANEEIDVIQPQATADILTQLEDLAGRGVEVVTGDTGTYEHVDLVFNNGGPFDPATYGGDEEIARLVRQAILKTIPRQDIVDRLIVPLNPNATTRDSFTQIIGAPGYDAIVAASGITDYSEVDIEGAIALLAEAGVETPIDVRTHFAENNPRRANEYDLMAASAAEAGFNLIDGRSASWGSELSDNSIYDMTFFGWQSTAVAVADTEANFVTTGQNNYGRFSSETVDALYEELKGTTDPARQQEILAEVEAELIAAAFGVPLFQFPGVAAFNGTYVSGVNPIPISPTIFYNVWDWEAS